MLRSKPGLGPIVQGEMDGCGPDCEIDLGEILLEYALSCEGCKDDETAWESAGLFGVQLGRKLAVRLCKDSEPIETMVLAFTCILNSLQVPFTLERTADRIKFSLAHSPLEDAAQRTGFNRGITTAHRALTALCRTMVRAAASNWTLIQPSRQEAASPTVVPIRALEIAKMTTSG